jgi:hypothetical protein
MAGENQSMSTPGQLVEVMADVLGISKATVTQYDRALAENGLRSKSGRGTSAAKVTSRDAANLLIALGASSPSRSFAKEAAHVCARFASLITLGDQEAEPQGEKSNFHKLGLMTLASLPIEHSFRQAITALIESAANNELRDLPVDGLLVRFLGPRPLAHILIGSRNPGALTVRLAYFEARKSKTKRSSVSWLAGDLVYESLVGLTTIRALGTLVSGEPITE